MVRRLLLILAILFTSQMAFAKPAVYRAIIMPYEETFLENNQEIFDKNGDLVSTFYGLSPLYANLVLARSRGVLFADQLEEVFPGQRFNALIMAEFKRYLSDNITNFTTQNSALEFVNEVIRRGVKVFVYSMTDPDLIQEDIKRRQLPVTFIKPSTSPGASYPPLDRILSRYQLAADDVIVIGGSQHECNQAGMVGLDFALYHEMVEARVEGERPCVVTYKLLQLKDLKTLLINKAAGVTK